MPEQETATVVKLPQLGESIAEGTVGRWLKQPGERVERDEPLVEVQTDKVNAEIPSPVAGVLQQILVQEGATVAVQTPIAIIGPSAATPPAQPLGSASAGSVAPIAPGETRAGRTAVPPTPVSGAALTSANEGGARTAVPPPSFSYDTSPQSGGGVVSSAAADSAEPGADGRAVEWPVAGSAADHGAPAGGAARTLIHGDGGRGSGHGSGPAGARPTDAVAFPAGSDANAGPLRRGAADHRPPVGTAASKHAAGALSDGSGSAPAGEGKRFFTPVVLRLAQEHGLDLARVEGTGLGGRVTRKDLERCLAGGSQQIEVPAAPAGPGAEADAEHQAPSMPPAPVPDVAPVPAAQGEVRALSPMRRAIAQHMQQARASIPDAWSMTEVDVTRLVALRARLLPEWQAREGFELTFLPFFIQAVLAGLKAVPELNATWLGEKEGVQIHHAYHLGIAVSVEGGIVVPVLRDADSYSVAGLARGLRQIVQKARSGKLQLDDLQGGTFTVNNPGALGSIMSQPIVPLRQSGIVTMEAIRKEPVVLTDAEGNDTIAIRSRMNVCLSFDHRVLDGSEALRFLRTVKEAVERAEPSIG